MSFFHLVYLLGLFNRTTENTVLSYREIGQGRRIYFPDICSSARVPEPKNKFANCRFFSDKLGQA